MIWIINILDDMESFLLTPFHWGLLLGLPHARPRSLPPPRRSIRIGLPHPGFSPMSPASLFLPLSFKRRLANGLQTPGWRKNGVAAQSLPKPVKDELKWCSLDPDNHSPAKESQCCACSELTSESLYYWDWPLKCVCVCFFHKSPTLIQNQTIYFGK